MGSIDWLMGSSEVYGSLDLSLPKRQQQTFSIRFVIKKGIRYWPPSIPQL